MKSKLILGLLTVLSFNFAHAAPSMSEAQLKQVIGTYQGDSDPYDGLEDQITCQVTISVNQNQQVVISLKDKDGTPLYSRAASGPGSKYSVHRMKEYIHPLMSVKSFLKSTTAYDGDFQNVVDRGSLKASESWLVRIANLESEYGFIQMSYDKVDRFAFMDATLAYIPDLNGCYNLKKVK